MISEQSESYNKKDKVRKTKKFQKKFLKAILINTQ